MECKSSTRRDIIQAMTKLIDSFGWAMNGIRTVWREEVNFRIEVAIAIIVIALGFWLNLLILEWIIISACIGTVFASEMLNTAIEDLCNKVEPNIDPTIGRIKDIMGGFVLVVSITSVIIGLIIFSNYL